MTTTILHTIHGRITTGKFLALQKELNKKEVASGSLFKFGDFVARKIKMLGGNNDESQEELEERSHYCESSNRMVYDFSAIEVALPPGGDP